MRSLTLRSTHATSVTHDHLLGILNTEADARSATGTLRLLDVGCGHGDLLEHLIRNLPILQPTLDLECYGLDVSDSGMMPPGFLDGVVDRLGAVDPAVDWSERISLSRSADPWPYPDNFFDVVVSNQVMEHVDDHDAFFAEVKRTLKEGGYSVHLFPLEHCVWEWHLGLPLFHRLKSHDSRTGFLRLAVRLGLKRIDPSESADTYSEREADIMRDFTNYLSQRETHRLGKRAKLRTSFRYTREFYAQKLRQVAGRPPRRAYGRRRLAVADFVSVLVLRYVAAVTLFLEKSTAVSDARDERRDG